MPAKSLQRFTDDLSQAGVPVHSTAFRPIDEASLSRNPFRMFTSLLRLELIENA
ncbi:hypothetical protein C4794_26615, partial [Salmonella enterica subsp. enterica serovar Anatum]